MSFNKGTSAHNHKFLLLLCAHENNNLLSEKKNKLIFSFLLLLNCNCWFVFCLSIPSRPHVTDDTLRKKGKKKIFYSDFVILLFFENFIFYFGIGIDGIVTCDFTYRLTRKKKNKMEIPLGTNQKKRNKSLVIGMNVFVVCVCHRSLFCSLFLIPSFLLFLFKKIVYRFSIEQQQNI